MHITYYFRAIGLLPFAVAFVTIVLLVARISYPSMGERISLRIIKRTLLGFLLTYPAILSILQWWVWSRDTFTRTFLALPLSPLVSLPPWLSPIRALFAHAGGYFAFYSFGRFWLHSFIVLACAGLFLLVMRSVSYMKPGSISDQDMSLAFIAGLLAGWPGFPVFLIVFSMSAIIYALYNAVRGHMSFSIAFPLIFSSAATVVLGNWLITIFHLSVLNI